MNPPNVESTTLVASDAWKVGMLNVTMMVKKARWFIVRGFGLTATSVWLSAFAEASEEAESSSVDMRRRLSMLSSVVRSSFMYVRV